MLKFIFSAYKTRIMKNILLLLAALILGGLTVSATNTDTNLESRFNNGYGDSYIFIENGIEFSIFPDGQFDFNIPRYHSNINVNIGSPNLNISFNSGYNYNAYVQYDEFGAVIQIENTPIYYDYFGRVAQAGHVNINYNNRGFINRVGGLYVHYNNYNRFTHTSGFINRYNKGYVFRPWHRSYIVPAINYCVVYNTPYRQYYNPVRYRFNKSFYNNYRPITAVATRRGNTISRHQSYATVNRSRRNVTKVNTYNSRAYRNNNSNTMRRNSNQVKNYSHNRVATTNSNNRNVNRQYTTTNRNLRVSSPAAANTNTRTGVKRQTSTYNNRTIRSNTTRVPRNRVTQKPLTSNSRSTYSHSTTRRASQVQNKIKTIQRSSAPKKEIDQ